MKKLIEKISYRLYQWVYSAVSWRMRIKFRRWMNTTGELLHGMLPVDQDDALPKISVIILCHNNLEYSKLCIKSVLEKTIYPQYEIILVDNASTDGTGDYVHTLQHEVNHIHSVQMATNTGFAEGNNQGVRIASGEIIVFLNNDTIVTTGWLSKFEKHLRDESIGLIGPAVNFSGNETRVPAGYQGIEEIDAYACFYSAKYAQAPFEIDVVPFHCVAIRKEIWDSVGELDHRFGIGMFEDDDYSLRVKKLGYQNVCADDIFIHHWGRMSFSKLDNQEHDKLFNANKSKFEEKWGIQWKPHKHRALWKYLL